jgi:hypothetical protein
MKTKKVTINDVDYTIAPLSVGQVDEIIFANIEARKENGEIVAAVVGTKRFIRTQICPAIAASFNNVQAGNGNWFASAEKWDGQEWNPDRAFGEFLYEEAMKLYNEISSLSGLRSTVEATKRNVGKLGEEPAVSAVH